MKDCVFSVSIAVVIIFAVVAKGAHDIWAATAVYTTVLLLCAVYVMLTGLRNYTSPISLPLAFPVMIFWVVMSVSFLGSSNPGESYLAFMDWTSAILLFYLAVNVFRSENVVDLFCMLMVPLLLTEYTVMVYQRLANTHLVELGLTTWKEPTGTFINGNSAVAFFLLWIPYLGESVRKTSPRSRWYWASGLAAIIMALGLVGSTWSLFSLFIGGMIYVGKVRLRGLFARYPVFSWTFLILVSVTLGGLIFYKLALIYSWVGISSERISTSRLDWWISVLKMCKEYPWFGVGIGNFPSAYLSFKTGPGENTLYAHGFIMQIIAEMGLAGLASVVLFSARWWALAKNQIEHNRRLIGIGLCMFLVFSLLHVSMEYLSNALACGVFLGIVVAAEKENGWNVRPLWSVCFVLAVFLCFPFILSPFLASRHIVDGNDYLKEKNWVLAEKHFGVARDIDGRSWEPYAGLAKVAFFQGDYKRAVEMQEEALKRNRLSLPLKRELAFYSAQASKTSGQLSQ
ncbi:MAG: hypothetical protein KCHDKBKB_01805 [Elusimicrobia bacterium]|nr:hypothetical protein [Elusimicrobiota bacterium]